MALFAACDSTAPQDLFGIEVFVEGMVTSAPSYVSDWTDLQARISDATVTASAINLAGNLEPPYADVITGAEGRYHLTTLATPYPLVVQASKGGFYAATLLEEGLAEGPVEGGVMIAPPMTAESTAEVAVFLRARPQSPHVTVADVSALIGRRMVTGLNAGHVTTDQVAAAIIASMAAQSAYARLPNGGNAEDISTSAVAGARRAAYATFRRTIVGTQSGQERRLAVDAFIETYADSWARAGLAIWPQAQTSIVSHGALRHYPGVSSESGAFALSHRALLIAMANTSVAIVHGFAFAGSDAGAVGNLTLARVDLFSSIQQAETQTDITAALDAFRAVVLEELGILLDKPMSDVQDVYESIIPLRDTLHDVISTTAHPETVAAAYITYFTAARDLVDAALGPDAGIAPVVIASLGAF